MTHYIGRFAPSPTGPLHFGSVVAAVASYLDARSHDGQWLVRIDDLDPPREVKGAADQILQDLEKLGLYSDAPVVYQSQQQAHYDDALQTLRDNGLAFPCGCARRDLPDSGIYPGTCANGLLPDRTERSVRLRVDKARTQWLDLVQGVQRQDLEKDVGAFVVRRADGLSAYQLAVVVDDARAGVTHVVRGADLAGSTPRQIHLQHVLGLPTPYYAHVPVALDERGRKLSKATGAAAIKVDDPVHLLESAWLFLTGDERSPGPSATLDDWWPWAIAHWSLSSVPAVHGMPLRR